MKPLVALVFTVSNCAAVLHASTSNIEDYLEKADSLQLAKQTTWQRLMYADASGKSEVRYKGYFYHENGQNHPQQELKRNIEELFKADTSNASIRCRFPARSQFLIQALNIPEQELGKAECTELKEWLGQIKPYKATLIYATDFMGNPSSMFGHTLLRLDPKDQAELNLVSYALNYAATVEGEQSWSYAWKGLTGQYPGEYSLMPYYRKVKEYGDFESRDLWEYELSLNPEQTEFLVKHIWEMKHVQFPYYFVQDNCAYRLLGLIDLVRPDLNLKQQFKAVAIPVETVKAMDEVQLIKDVVYRPALETQLLAQSRQHGHALAKVAHHIAMSDPQQHQKLLEPLDQVDRAKVLEMAYDDLYLHFTAAKIDPKIAQPRLRQILVLRSQIALDKQRIDVTTPKTNPVQGHDARNISVHIGEVQGDSFVEIGHRQAYHDLIDPQGGFRVGTQLKFWDGSIQYRNGDLKLEHFDFLSVNAYNPISAFKTPLSWGFDLGWQQEALDQDGQFSEDEQHGVTSLKTQMGYSWTNSAREHICYAQMQTQLQAGTALEQGWRVGMGPAVGCQNIWTDQINSLIQIELPYWHDSQQWQFKSHSQVQYAFNAQNAVRLSWQYQQQQSKDWQQWGLGLIRYF